MFLVATWPARIAKDEAERHQTAVFYDQKPEPSLWAVVTYKNVAEHPITGINHFETEEQARSYMMAVEPWIPLVSLGGQSPTEPLSPDDFQRWKEESKLADYNPNNVVRLGTTDRGEVIVQTMEQFASGLQQVAAAFRGPKA
jgi:hypothetical protein